MEFKKGVHSMHSVKDVLRTALTTTNASDIGIMYIIVAIVSLIIGSLDASMIRIQLTFNVMNAVDYYDVVSLHGIFMIFFVVMPMSVGLANYLIPRMIGAHDLYWPKINALSFWILPPAVTLAAVSTLFGPVDTGWYMYAPLSTDLAVNGGFGVDLVEISLIIAGISSTLTGINFLMTILRLRKVPMFKMSLFTWSFLATSILLVVALPPLTGGLVMAFLERNWGLPFFDASKGGDPILWEHLFWFFGHPEVYILILPAMGLVSEILPRAAGRPIYGYKAIALSSMAIAFLSAFSVWMHHMFTAIVNDPVRILASSMTMAIAIPSGIKVFNWTATLYGGKMRYSAPAVLAVGFVALFLVGGITGVFFPLIPVDYAFNGTYAVVGHFHYMVFAILAGLLGGLMYYFPYFTGKMYDYEMGKSSALMIVIGGFVISTGMFIEGVLGMPRRYAVVPSPIYQPFQPLIDVGGIIMGVGLLMGVGNMLYAWVRGAPVTSLDPWNAQESGQPDFTLKPVALPLSFGKAMDGSEPEEHHGTWYPSILGLLMSFPALGFLLILHGMIPPGAALLAIFMVIGFSWLYRDYFGSIGGLPSIGGEEGGVSMPMSKATGPLKTTTVIPELKVTHEGLEIARKARTPVLFFIMAEIFLFGSFIGGYLYVRNVTPEAQTLPPLHLDIFPLPAIMTAILLSSSIPAHLAYNSLEKGNLRMYKVLGILTFLMGFTFLMGQVYEFTHIIDFTPQQDVFTAFFYTIVNLHAFHVIMGLTIWAFTLMRARKMVPYEISTAATYYWHFVDAIWVIVFTMLYLQLPIYHP